MRINSKKTTFFRLWRSVKETRRFEDKFRNRAGTEKEMVSGQNGRWNIGRDEFTAAGYLQTPKLLNGVVGRGA